MIKLLSPFIMLPITVYSFFSPLTARTFFVDQKNASALDQNTGTSAMPWKTISKANQTLIAGDTVLIKSGNYKSYIAPVRSGISGNYITYKNFASDSVTISDTICGIYLVKKSYIAVEGINFYNCDQFLWLEDSSNHNRIEFCNFDKGRTIGWSGSKIYRSSSYNLVANCRFSKYGKFTNDDIGSILDIGNEESATDFSNYNCIENCTLYHGGHHILGLYGMDNVIRNNFFHNENWQNNYGDRNVYLAGYPANSGRNLIEGNGIGYSGIPPDNWGASGMALTTASNIVRFNRFYYNNTSGISMTVTSSYYSDIVYNKIYNNSFLHNGFNMATGPDAMTSAIGAAVYSGPHIIKNNSIINNIFYDHYQAFGWYNASSSDQTFSSNWDSKSKGDPKFISASLTLSDPMNLALPDLHLQSASKCIDSGSCLTTIATASGAGISFQVADAGYFMDGWKAPGVLGDEIQLAQSSQRARITAVNYATNTITVDKSLSWAQGQGIALTYSGSAPDIGAFEFTSQGSKISPDTQPGDQKNPKKNRASHLNHSGSKIGLYNISGQLLATCNLIDNATYSKSGVIIANDSRAGISRIMQIK